MMQKADSLLELETFSSEMKEMGNRLHVRVLRSVEEIEAARQIWASWQWNPNADIDFYLRVLHLRSEIVRPHVLVLYRDGLPSAMLVGRLVLGQVGARLGYARLFKTQVRSLIFIQGGLAGDLSWDNSAILISEVIRSLREREADLAEFRFVRTDSVFYQGLTQYPGFFTRDRFPVKQAHLSMALPDRGDDIYRRLSGKVRKNLRWQAKKLLEDFGGNVEIRCFRNRIDLDRMFTDVEVVARTTYHRALGFGFIDSPEMRDRVQLEADKGWFRAYVLYLASKPAAFWIGNVSQGRFYSGFLGFDSAHSRHSPGIFLMTKVLEGFCSDGVNEVDFGLGDAEYKRRFGNASWEEACIDIFSPSLKGMTVNIMRLPGIIIDWTIRKTLENTQILPRIKKFWRDHARESSRPGSKDN